MVEAYKTYRHGYSYWAVKIDGVPLKETCSKVTRVFSTKKAAMEYGKKEAEARQKGN